jgi:serine/threonine-protein kinase RsbW
MELQLRSTPTCIGELEQCLRTLFDQFALDPALYPNILVSLTEAVNNAVEHGNQNDISKTVCVRVAKYNKVLRCEITDQGGGFDPGAIPDPTAPDNIEKPGGRGVFLMRQLCDSIRFKDNGSTVELVFHLQ